MDSNFVTQQECEDRRDKLEELITAENLRTTIIETKMGEIVWWMRTIAASVVSVAVAYVYSIVK